MPQNSVNALVQDRQGYLWVGTFGGLARFDGERFQYFGSAELPGFGAIGITSLFESRSGALWVGTLGGGLARLDHGVITKYTERDGLPTGFIDTIRGDPAGNVWIKTSGGLARFADGKLAPYPTHRGKAVREFYLQARDGSMWFRQGEEVLRFGADGSFATFNVGQPSVFLIHEARDGSVWIAARDAYRLVRYSQGRFSDVRLPPAGRRALRMRAREFALDVAEDGNGELLVFTQGGLVRTDGGKVSGAQALPLPSDGAGLIKARSLLVDREGNLWVGLIASGLVRLRPAPLTAFGKNEGISDRSFNTVFQDREGRIWMGGDSLGWFDGRRFHVIPGVVHTTAIAQTRDGDLWFGGYGELHRWRSGVLTRYEIESFLVSGIHQDEEGALWIGGAKGNRRGGLYQLRHEKLDRTPGISGVQEMTGDWNGGFLAMADEGLFHVRGGKVTTSDRSIGSFRDVAHFYQDSAGTLWFATNDGQLSQLRDGRLKTIPIRQGLSTSVLLCFLDDGRGSLWASSHHNMFRLNLKELNDFADGRISSILPVSYGVAEGMRSSDANWGSPGIWQTRDGRIWFPTVRGVVAIDPNSPGHLLPPPVVLETATANGVKISLDGGTSISPGNNTFDFAFVGLSLSAPDNQRFKYRLDPHDETWIDAGTQRTAHYTNMRPGEYSFQVIAANSFGVWNNQGAGTRFVLRPHYYQTYWFYALCACALAALLWMAHALRLRRLQRAFDMRLHERVAERTRIARELHDTLLQSFQGAAMLMQAAYNLLSRRPEKAAETLQKAIDSSTNAITEAREAIQDMRSANVERNDLARALRIAGEQMAAAGSAKFEIRVEGEPRDLHPVLGGDIYRIALEAMRNAFQHAAAKAIEAEIVYGDSLRLRVRDDGKGIDPDLLQEGRRSGHYGFLGMRERAKRICGKLDVRSACGGGTEVELIVPGAIAFGGMGTGSVFRRFRSKGKSKNAAHS